MHSAVNIFRNNKALVNEPSANHRTQRDIDQFLKYGYATPHTQLSPSLPNILALFVYGNLILIS